MHGGWRPFDDSGGFLGCRGGVLPVTLVGMSGNRYVVIMAGGRGERFWPQSRLKRPKHLLPIVGDQPMITQTVERLSGMIEPSRVFIVTNREQRDAIVEACPTVPPENIVGEPMGRDTAAAVGLSLLLVKSRDPEAAFAMLPADAAIHDREGFQRVLATAFGAAEESAGLVTIGIRPTFAATGYGYVHRGPVAFQVGERDVYAVERFVEKPDQETARKYLDSGEYLWNAGMFIWRVPVIAREFSEHTPALWAALGEIEAGIEAGEAMDSLLERTYPGLEKISVDYAIMEKARKVLTVESDFDWDDVGEWPAVARHFDPDEAGNVVRGRAVLREARDNIVINEGGHLTAVIGVDDLIVVQTGDATLICPKSRAQQIKALVREIGDDPDTEHLV